MISYLLLFIPSSWIIDAVTVVAADPIPKPVPTAVKVSDAPAVKGASIRPTIPKVPAAIPADPPVVLAIPVS